MKTWWRFSQGVGKQYSDDKGREELCYEECLKQGNKYLKQEIGIFKQYKELAGLLKD
ncbi:hypothetical protein [Enterococcus sp. CWB-B31]|uniref:hypothetical protein n=1 Tax=Enterococcus sp. CWB-B31 TaxID=2885159 RepID=UPI001E49A885|nr:hypothetical protein [Enterococcus sp. CWB-B31]MCB5955961.1 hypothetical protein [Enterococcus sp. CWB-B31]